MLKGFFILTPVKLCFSDMPIKLCYSLTFRENRSVTELIDT